MKITMARAEEGILNFMQKEICPKFGDWRKWVLPVVAGLYIPAIEKKVLDNRELLKTAGFIDDENLIDIDYLYDKFHRVAEENGTIEQALPYMGTITFSSRDVETLYRMLRG